MCKEIWIKANLVSFIGYVCTIVGVYFCFINKIDYAVILLVASGVCDGLDGAFAKKFRKPGQNPEYGVQLDSLADIVCSGIFPVIICLSLGFTKWWNAIIYSFFMICGITRLVYYNINSSKNSFYKGVPITVSTFLIPIVYCFTKTSNLVYSIIFSLLGICYVLDIKIQKPNIGLRTIVSIIILGIVIFFFFIR